MIWSKKLLLVLSLLLFCLGLVYSQDITSVKQEIINELKDINKQLIALDIRLQNSKAQIVSLQKVISDLKKELENSQNSLQSLNYELERQKQLLANLKADFLALTTTYNELLDQSEALSRKLSRLENREKWLIGGLIASGAVIIIETIIIFSR